MSANTKLDIYIPATQAAAAAVTNADTQLAADNRAIEAFQDGQNDPVDYPFFKGVFDSQRGQMVQLGQQKSDSALLAAQKPAAK